MNAPRPQRPGRARFPFELFRRLRFGSRPTCPLCGHRHVHGWGGFADRQRYRCLRCRRTFSDFTGTPLAYLKRIDLWPAFGRCMLRSWSVRRAGRWLGVAKNTVFRWRHRLLDALLATDTRALASPIVIGETRFAYSEKGGARLERTECRPCRETAAEARRRALGQLLAGARLGDPIWVVLGLDAGGRLSGEISGRRRPTADDLSRTIGPRLQPATELLTATGSYGSVARLASRERHLHRRIRASHDAVRRVTLCGVELKRWLVPFRGVSTKYLSNYLVWNRVLRLAPVVGEAGLAQSLLSGAFP